MSTIFFVACFVINGEVHCFQHRVPDMETCIDARKSFRPGSAAGFGYCLVKK